jgi:HK97 family phage major capsid protein
MAGFNVNEARARRHDLFQTADSLVMAARQERRDLNDIELQRFDGCIAQMKRIDAQLDNAEAEYGDDHPPMERIKDFPELPHSVTNQSRSFISVGPRHPRAVDMKAVYGEIEAYMRGQILAADTPMYISTAPTSAGVAAAIHTEVLAHMATYTNLDSFFLAGATVMNTESTVPLVKPIISAGPDADTFEEGASATDSHPFASASFTFGGTKYARLVKVSEESLMNSAIPLSTAIVDELAAGVASTFTKAVTTALLAALTGNSGVLTAEGSNDIYKTLLSLMHAVPPRFNLPANAWMLSRATLAKIKDSRATSSGVPFFNPETNQIFGKTAVLNDNLTGGQVVYGSWVDGAFVRKSPFILLRLQELYSAQGLIGFKATQFLDQHFLAELTGVTVQPLHYTVLS